MKDFVELNNCNDFDLINISIKIIEADMELEELAIKTLNELKNNGTN